MQSGKSRSAVLILSLLLFGFAVGSIESSGQIGGFLKKKAKDIVSPSSSPDKTGASASTDSESNATPKRDTSILDLNIENLDKLRKALEFEKTAMDKVRNDFSREKYEKCQQETMMSPDALKISEESKDDYAQLTKRVMELLEKKCGKSPSQLDESAAIKDAKDKAARSGGFTDRQYTMLIERVVPFCRVGGQEKVKGSGTNMFYVYTPSEVSALKPECPKLMPLIEGVGAAKSY